LQVLLHFDHNGLSRASSDRAIAEGRYSGCRPVEFQPQSTAMQGRANGNSPYRPELKRIRPAYRKKTRTNLAAAGLCLSQKAGAFKYFDGNRGPEFRAKCPKAPRVPPGLEKRCVEKRGTPHFMKLVKIARLASGRFSPVRCRSSTAQGGQRSVQPP